MAKDKEEIVGLTQLKQELSATLQRVRRSNIRLVVTERGKAAAVLLSVDAYEQGKKETKILKLLARGEKEIAAGNMFIVSLSPVAGRPAARGA